MLMAQVQVELFLIGYKPMKQDHSQIPKQSTFQNPVYIAKSLPAFPFAQQEQVISAKKMASYWLITINVLAVAIALGHALTEHVN
jgi:hypothetical protein